MFCSKCGNEIPDNCKFCSKCGTAINSDVQNSKNRIPFDFNKIIKNKKYMAIAATAITAVILIIVIISSLGGGGVSKKQICDDISFYAGFEDYDLDIVEYDEEKRDTNKESKYDQIWVNVVAENDDIRFTGSYVIMYKLYNDGWTYEYVDAISSDYSAIKELDEERIKEDLLSEYNDLVTVYRLEDINIDMTLPLDTTTLKTIDLRCIGTAKNDEMTVEAVINVTYELKMDFEFCGWQLTECEMSNYSYAATTEPTEELISKTTNSWTNKFTLVSSTKTSNNIYEYIYSENDNKTFDNISVEWKKQLTFTFTPDDGWKLTNNTKELSDLEISADGVWRYSQDGESATLKIVSVNKNKVKFNIDMTYIPEAFGSTAPARTFSENNIEREWTYKYNEVAQCIIFSAEEYIAQLPDLYHNTYPKISYWVYANDTENDNGYHIDTWRLKKAS